MSWAKDEWKQDLTPKVLQHITSLENELQSLQKLKSQHELKIDGCAISLEKERANLQETKALNTALQNEIQELMAKKSNLEAKQEKYINEIKGKENYLARTEEILEKVRQKLKTETAKSVELQRSVDIKRTEAESYAEKSETLSMEVARLKQEKLSLVKDNEGLQEKLTVFEKEKESIEASHPECSDDQQTAIEENEPRVVTAKSSSSDVMLDMLKKENTALVRDLDDTKQQCEQLRHVVEEKEKEVERGRTKITNMTVEMQATKIYLKEKEQKVQRLEVALENSRLGVLKLQKEVDKHKENEENTHKDSNELENVGKVPQVQQPQHPEKEDEKQENQDETTLEELMALLAENLKRNPEMRNIELELKPCHVIQNLSQVIVVTQDHEKSHEKNNVTQSTQTMCITEFDQPSNAIPNDEQETTNTSEDDDKEDDQEENECSDRNEAFDSFGNNMSPKKFSQICDILAGVQKEHEVILESAKECVSIVATIKEALERPGLNFMALLYRLSNQLEVIVDVSKCSKLCLEYLDKEILAEVQKDYSDKEGVSPRGSSSGSYKDKEGVSPCGFSSGSYKDKEGVSPRGSSSGSYKDKEGVSPRGSSSGSYKDKEGVSPRGFSSGSYKDKEGVSPRGSSSGSYKDTSSESKKDLSWDNFESDQVFQKFKENMDTVLMEMEGQTARSERKRNVKDKEYRVSDSPQAQTGSRGVKTSSTNGENCHGIEQIVEILEKLVDGSNARWFEKNKGLFKDFEQNLKNTIHDQIKTTLDEKTQKLKDHRPLNEDGGVGLKEEKNVFQELEFLKLKIDDVQKIVRHLLATVEVAESEKEEAYSHVDLLSNHVHTLESDHEMRCRELQENIKSASDREISLQRKWSNLKQEKDEVDNYMRESTKHLQQREQELLKTMKKIKKMQLECEQTETKLKNENKALLQQNCSIWRDYEKAASELEDKNRELKSLMDSMKTTEHSLLSLFNTIGNIDDFLQRARDMNLFQ